MNLDAYETSNDLATIKRKRGRPRRVELTDDFDINLIQEFEKRPDLYDRNAPNFKDKAYHDELWEELSHCLGYDVSVVKDRMVQIRNKYHLEKKRLETQRNDNPKAFAESKWPLFEQLGFLSEHIPVRRSFRTMPCKRKYSESEYVIKSEPDTDGSDADRGKDNESRNGRKVQVRPYGNSVAPKNDRNSSYLSGVRNGNGPAPTRLARLPRQVYASRHAQAVYQRKPNTPIKSNLPPGSEKFYAFGQFLTSSLIELPETEALVLVDQFTSDLVQVYLAKHNENDKQRVEEEEDGVVFADEACNGHDVLATE